MRTYPSTNPIVQPLGKAYLDLGQIEPSMHPSEARLQLDTKAFTLSTHELQVRRSSFDITFLPHHLGSATLISTFCTLHVSSIELGGSLDSLPGTQLDRGTSNNGGNLDDGDAAGDDDIETEEDDDDDLGEEDEFDEDEGLAEEGGNDGDPGGDEDEYNDDDEDDDLPGNGSDREDDLESIEEIKEEEDEDDSDLTDQAPDEELDDEDDDEDEEEYGTDWDEDDDDLDDDDDELKGLNFSPRPNSLLFSPTPILGSKPTPLSRANPNNTGQGPESIDYDIT